LIYSREEANEQAAVTCLLHFKYKSQRFPIETWSMPTVNLDGEHGAGDGVLGLLVDLSLLRPHEHRKIPRKVFARSSARKLTEIKMIATQFELHATYFWATYCRNAMHLRSSHSIRLGELLREFIADDGSSPAFGAWAAGLFNFIKVGAIRQASQIKNTREKRPQNPWLRYSYKTSDWDKIFNWDMTVVLIQSKSTCSAKLSGLLIACLFGFMEILKVDSKHGEAQVMRNHEGNPGLLIAYESGHHEILDLPIDRELAPGLLQLGGKGTLLHKAVSHNYTELATFLLGYPRDKVQQGERVRFPGLDVNSTNSWGQTPLHLAALKKGPEYINLLLNEDDLDVHARDNGGLTALQLGYPGRRLQEPLRKDRRYLPSDENCAQGDPRGKIVEA
jgi:hypothetical protein